MNTSPKNIKKIAYSSIVMALYIVVMFVTQSFAFGQFQIRIATGIYALAFHCPFLVLPLALANMLSNFFMGGLGIIDIVGGFVIGLITSGTIALLGRTSVPAWAAVLPIAVFPAFIVPIWLSVLLNIPYIILCFSLVVGQIISAYTLGLFIIRSKRISALISV